MPAKKRSAATKKTAKTTKKTGGGAKSKTGKAKKQSRAVATAKKKEAAVKVTAEAAPKRKTRTKAPRTKIKKLDVPVTLTAEEIEEQEYSDEEYNKMLVMYESTIQDFKEGEIVEGKVMAVTRDDVIVDVGFCQTVGGSIFEFPRNTGYTHVYGPEIVVDQGGHVSIVPCCVPIHLVVDIVHGGIPVTNVLEHQRCTVPGINPVSL